MSKWLDEDGSEKDIVISSRMRLARNIEKITLPQRINEKDGIRVVELVEDAVKKDKDDKYELYNIKDLTLIERKLFVENHLISPDLLKKPKISSFLLREDDKVTVMINEEDHIRIQALFSGLNLDESFKLCNKVDDLIEDSLDYSFDEKFGYITSCPTNTGTGLRASVMVHLPCLVMTGNINGVLQAVNQLGIAVRGLYGEGSGSLGNIFQISNQITLGETEEDIISKLKGIVTQIINRERQSRAMLLNNKRIEAEDKIYRSLGTLQNARILSSKEAMNLLSDVRMGVGMGILENMNINMLDNLIIEIQPANIDKDVEEELNSSQRDIKRAEILREKLKI